METYSKIFKKVTGVYPTRDIISIRSNNPLDRTVFEKLSRLYYENQRKFNYLRKESEKRLNLQNQLIKVIIGYIYYIECEFKEALQCFEKALLTNKDDLELIYNIAFCHRQLGDDLKFEKILINKKVP